jgi:hypothetical protein
VPVEEEEEFLKQVTPKYTSHHALNSFCVFCSVLWFMHASP